MKKIYSLLIALLCSATMAFAYDAEIDGIYYNFDQENKTATVTNDGGYLWDDNGAGYIQSEIVIPEKVTYNGVEYSVTSIGVSAFYSCSSLTSVTIPESIIDIASDAFYNCNLTSVQWNAINCGDFYSYKNAPFRGGDSYENFSLKSFTFGENVKHIPAYICYNLKNLNTVSIPKSVETVGTEAFEGTAWLDNQPEGCVYINNCLYDYKNGSLTQIEVREGTTQICTSAFSDANITSITIPNSVTEIGGGVFYNCTALKSIVFSTNMNSLPCYRYSDYGTRYQGFFQNCSSLESITIPNNIVEIGDLAFEGCSTLVSIEIPNSVIEIGGGVFAGCRSLKTVILSENIKTLNTVNYYNSYEYNGEIGFFEECTSLESIAIPNSVTEIGTDAFYGCSSLTSIEIPNSVIYLGDMAFANCYSLRYAKLGKGFRTNNYEDEDTDEPYSYLGANLFYFEEGYYYINEDTENEELVWMSSPLDTLICEFIDCDLGESGGVGFDDDGLLQNPLNTTKNLRYFQGPAKLVNLIKEEFQTQFSNKLTEVHITDGELDENGFNYINRSKKSLHTIDLAGTTNTAINDLAFYDCYKLENLMLPSNLETIGFKAVAECYQLKEINIPASVVEINDAAFENCRSIKSITFGGQAEAKSFSSRMKRAAASGDVALQRIGNWAFYNCHALENLVIPEGVTEVGDAAFYGCTYLDSLALPSTTQRIGDNCFALCSRMKQINVNAIEPPTIFAKTFFDVNRNIPVIVPEGARDAYANDEYWGEFINVVESEDEETQIENAENANVAIYSVGGVLYVDGLSADYQVFDVNGRLIYTGRDTQLSLPRGVYMIHLGDEIKKIML